MASVVTAVSRNYLTLLAVTVTMAALAAAVMPQAFAYTREAAAGTERAAMVMSTLRTVFSIAWVAGPPLAAVLLDTGGFKAVYTGAAVMYAAAALVVLITLPARTNPLHVDRDAPPAARAADAAPRLV